MKRVIVKFAQLVLFLIVFVSGVAVGMEEAMREREALLKRLSDQDKRYQQIQDLQNRFQDLQGRSNIIAIDLKFIQCSREWVCIFLEEGYQNQNRRSIDSDVLINVKNHMKDLSVFEDANMKKLEVIQKEMNELIKRNK